MPLPWLTIVKVIPWGEVLANAPKVLEQAKKLVAAHGKSGSLASEKPFPPAQERPGGMPAIEARLASVEDRVEDIAREAVASVDLIKSLAEQNAKLIQALQALESKMRRQRLIGAVLLCVVVGMLIAQLVFAR